MATRVSQALAEALYQPTDQKVRLSQVVLEVLVSAAEPSAARPRFWAFVIG